MKTHVARAPYLRLAVSSLGLLGAASCAQVLGLDAFQEGTSGSGGGTTGSSSSGSGSTGSSSSGSGSSGSSSSGGTGACVAGAKRACYSGPTGTEKVGLCKGGQQTCTADGTEWGACVGEVLPAAAESCTTAEDDTCDGKVNEGCSCTAGMAMACYGGPAATKDTGACHAGTQTCKSTGMGFEDCAGQVMPTQEMCGDPADENCDGFDCVQWAMLYGGPGFQTAQRIAVDGLGNSYVFGLGGNPFLLPTGTITTPWVLFKLDPMGTVLWGMPVPTGVYFSALEADTTGNVVVAGTAEVGAVVGGAQLVVGSAFVVKFDGSGKAVWNKTLTVNPGANVFDYVTAVALTSTGDVVIGGDFANSLDVGDTVLPAPAASTGFFAKLRGSDGSSKRADGGWARTFSGASLTGIRVDGMGRVALAGSLKSTLIFGDGLQLYGAPSDVFLAKFAADGTQLTWQAVVGGGVSGGKIFSQSFVMDGAGNLVIAGRFEGTVNLGGGNVPTATTPASAFVVSYGSDATYRWSKVIPESTGSFTAVTMDKTGNVLLAGTLKASLDLGGPPLELRPGTSRGAFLAKLGSAGALNWIKNIARPVGNNDPYISPVWMGVTAQGEPILAGQMSGTADFGTGPMTALGTDGDIFVTKFSP